MNNYDIVTVFAMACAILLSFVTLVVEICSGIKQKRLFSRRRAVMKPVDEDTLPKTDCSSSVGFTPEEIWLKQQNDGPNPYRRGYPRIKVHDYSAEEETFQVERRM